MKLNYLLSIAGTPFYRPAKKFFLTSHLELLLFDELISALNKYFVDQVLVAASHYNFFHLLKQPNQTYRLWGSQNFRA